MENAPGGTRTHAPGSGGQSSIQLSYGGRGTTIAAAVAGNKGMHCRGEW